MNAKFERYSAAPLIIGFGALLALMIGLAALAIYSLQVQQAQLDQVVDQRITRLEHALAMRKMARERTLSLLHIALLDDPFERDEVWLAYRGHGAHFAQAREALLAMPLSDEERQLLDTQGQLTGFALPLQQRVLDLINLDQTNQAMALLAKQSIPRQNLVIAVVDQFVDLQRRGVDAARGKASKMLIHARRWILALTAIAIVLGLLIALLVIRMVRRRGERDLYLASHDCLTGMPNRALLIEYMNSAIRRAQRTGDGFALLFIDIDRFKQINDGFGHGVGDQVLIAVSHGIQARLRGMDTLARLSGDEFVALLEEVEDVEQLHDRTESIVRNCGKGLRIGEFTIDVSVSVGLALYPQHGSSADELLMCGDKAMYASKQTGRNGWSQYQTGSAFH